MSIEWAMFILTAISVASNIFMCYANNKSAKATKEQVKEMQRQFELTNRPYIDVEFILVKNAFCGLRFINNGSVLANDVSINFSHDFIECLDPSIKSFLVADENKICLIGSNQSYEIYLGEIEYMKNNCKVPINGKVSYWAKGKRYEEKFSIDINRYKTMFTYNTELDDLYEEIKKQNRILKQLSLSADSISKGILKMK